jgi:hypothetical protein
MTEPFIEGITEAKNVLLPWLRDIIEGKEDFDLDVQLLELRHGKADRGRVLRTSEHFGAKPSVEHIDDLVEDILDEAADFAETMSRPVRFMVQVENHGGRIFMLSVPRPSYEDPFLDLDELESLSDKPPRPSKKTTFGTGPLSPTKLLDLFRLQEQNRAEHVRTMRELVGSAVESSIVDMLFRNLTDEQVSAIELALSGEQIGPFLELRRISKERTTNAKTPSARKVVTSRGRA